MENIGCALPSLRLGAAPLKRRKGTGHSQGQGWRAGRAAGDLKGAAGKIGSPKCQGGSASSKIPAGSDGKPVAAPAVGSGGAAGCPLPGRGDFWGARFAAAPPTRQGDPEGAEAPRDPGKIPFSGEPLGWVAAGRSRGSFGEVAKQFPVYSSPLSVKRRLCS